DAVRRLRHRRRSQRRPDERGRGGRSGGMKGLPIRCGRSAFFTAQSAHADAPIGEKLTGPAQRAVGGEGAPLISEILRMEEITKSAEGARAVDRPLQPFTQSRVALPPGEV